jgi:CrcB protein
MLNYLWVGIGGALGSIARFWLSGLIAEHCPKFPLNTLVINITGSFLIGIFAAMGLPEGRVYLGPNARLFLIYGICGGYTTFSSFSLQTMSLAQEGEWLYAGLNILLSVALCLLAVWLGYISAQALTK